MDPLASLRGAVTRDRCDVLVVGGGPAGSSCAFGLRDAGLDVVVVDRAHFPRDKVCAGWVTTQIIITFTSKYFYTI